MGEGKFVTERQIEYRTNVFEIMSFIIVNILRVMPIHSVSINEIYSDDVESKIALNNPNEYAILSMYDPLAYFYCSEYGLKHNPMPQIDKIRKLIFDRNKFVMSNNSSQLVEGLLRSGAEL